MRTILLVDDEQDLLDLFREVLEQMDYRVIEAHDGREALSLARQTPPALVVTDWMMPRMDGLELCHQLHADERLHDIPIIIHSSAGDPHAPGARFVPKSYPLEEFEGLVRRVLAHSDARRQTPPARAARNSCSTRTTLLFGLGDTSCSTAH